MLLYQRQVFDAQLAHPIDVFAPPDHPDVLDEKRASYVARQWVSEKETSSFSRSGRAVKAPKSFQPEAKSPRHRSRLARLARLARLVRLVGSEIHREMGGPESCQILGEVLRCRRGGERPLYLLSAALALQRPARQASAGGDMQR